MESYEQQMKRLRMEREAKEAARAAAEVTDGKGSEAETLGGGPTVGNALDGPGMPGSDLVGKTVGSISDAEAVDHADQGGDALPAFTLPEGMGDGNAPTSVSERVVPSVRPVRKARAKPVDAPKAKRGKGRPASKDTVTCRVDVPLSLIKSIEAQIPAASNRSDAVAAWIYVKSDKTADVPDYVKALAGSYAGDQTTNILKSLDEHVKEMDVRLSRQMRDTDGHVQSQWFMLAYLMLERMDEISAPLLKDLDVGLPVFDTLREMLGVQCAKELNRLKLQAGRNKQPIVK